MEAKIDEYSVGFDSYVVDEIGIDKDGKESRISLDLLLYKDGIIKPIPDEEKIGMSKYSQMYYAALRNSIKFAKYMIESGVDVNVKDNESKTPLRCASSIGNIKLLKYLIENGADVNAEGKYEEIPLHKVSSQGFTEIVELLIKNGVNVNIKNELGKTLLDFARETEYEES